MADRIQIESDDPEMAPLLRALEDQVRDAGGYLNPLLKVVVSRGQIRVESEAPEGTRLLRIPEACLPVIDAVEFGLSGDRLVVAAYPDEMGPVQRSVLDGMLAIYNRGQKLAAHRSESVWLALDDWPELLEQLHRGRKDAPKMTRRLESIRAGVTDMLLIEDFLGTRTLQYSFDSDRRGRVVMPFVDFFNHHSASPSFGRDGDALTVQASHPLSESAECFVKYSRLDALDAVLAYGFADTSARFLRSVPLRFELSNGGVIEVLGRVGRSRKKVLPKQLKLLRGWVPRIHRSDAGAIVANQLLIPRFSRKHVDILTNVLAMLHGPLMPGAAAEEMNTAVGQALEKAIQANYDYYQALAARLESVVETPGNRSVLQQLRRAVNFQLVLLDEWRDAFATIAHAVTVSHTRDTGAGWA